LVTGATRSLARAAAIAMHETMADKTKRMSLLP
jgi:hypothetical protein